MYFNKDTMKKEVVEGGITRYIYTGAHMQVVEYHFPPGKSFPMHRHEIHEQMGLLVSGRLGFMLDGQETVLLPGDYYHAALNVDHRAWTLDEEAVLIDFFSPPRDDLK